MLSVFGVEVSLKTLTLFLKNLVERSAVFALRSGTLVLSLVRWVSGLGDLLGRMCKGQKSGAGAGAYRTYTVDILLNAER